MELIIAMAMAMTFQVQDCDQVFANDSIQTCRMVCESKASGRVDFQGATAICPNGHRAYACNVVSTPGGHFLFPHYFNGTITSDGVDGEYLMCGSNRPSPTVSPTDTAYEATVRRTRLPRGTTVLDPVIRAPVSYTTSGRNADARCIAPVSDFDRSTAVTLTSTIGDMDLCVFSRPPQTSIYWRYRWSGNEQYISPSCGGGAPNLLTGMIDHTQTNEMTFVNGLEGHLICVVPNTEQGDRPAEWTLTLETAETP